MSPAAHFLNTLAQAVSAMALYDDGHPALEKAIDKVHGALSDLQDREVNSVFTFLGGEVIFGRRPLREMRHFPALIGGRTRTGGNFHTPFICRKGDWGGNGGTHWPSDG